jgi:MFS family permease
MPFSKNLEKKEIRALSILIWLCAALFYLYELVLRASPAVMSQDLMGAFHVTAASLGVLTSFYYYAYVVLQIPCGILVDRWGPRLVISFSAVLCTVGTLVFSQSSTLGGAQFARFLIGAGSACAYISCLKISVEWFHPSYFALLAGLTNMLGTLGGCLSGPPLAHMVSRLGWRGATWILGEIGFFMIILCWITIRDRPGPKSQFYSHWRPQLEQKADRFSLTRDLLKLFQSPQIILMGIVGGLMYLPISALAELWIVPFLKQTFQVSGEKASYGSTMIFLGLAIGGVLSARLSSRWSIRRVMEWSSLSTGLSFMGIVMAGYLGLNWTLILLLSSGILIGGQVLCFTFVKTQIPSAMSGTAMAFTNTLIMLSGTIFQPLLGYLLDWNWDGQLGLDGVRVYSNLAYQKTMVAIPVCMLLSWIFLRCLPRLKPFSFNVKNKKLTKS